jgi:hypothetical protein
MDLRPAAVADLPIVLGLLDGAVEWLVALGRTAQWADQPWSARPAYVPAIDEPETHVHLLVTSRQHGGEGIAGFTPTEEFDVDGWPGHILAQRLDQRPGVSGRFAPGPPAPLARQGLAGSGPRRTAQRALAAIASTSRCTDDSMPHRLPNSASRSGSAGLSGTASGPDITISASVATRTTVGATAR